MTCPVPRPRLYREHAELVNRMFVGEPLTEGERRRLRRVRGALDRYEILQWTRWENDTRKRPHAQGWHDWAMQEARRRVGTWVFRSGQDLRRPADWG